MKYSFPINCKNNISQDSSGNNHKKLLITQITKESKLLKQEKLNKSRESKKKPEILMILIDI